MKNTFGPIIWNRMPYLACIFLLFYCWNVYWGGKRSSTFFHLDSGGYYIYLPDTFIYHDYRFKFIGDIHQKYFSSSGNFDFRQKNDIVNKWFCGTAIAIAPFFFLAHLISLLTGTSPDGYTFWYAWGLNIAAIFYCSWL